MMTTEERIRFQQQVIEAQAKAINVFDDFFEYRYTGYTMEDAKDYAYRTLDQLEKDLLKLKNAYNV